MKVLKYTIFNNLRLHHFYVNAVLAIMFLLVGFCMLKACDAKSNNMDEQGIDQMTHQPIGTTAQLLIPFTKRYT